MHKIVRFFIFNMFLSKLIKKTAHCARKMLQMVQTPICKHLQLLLINCKKSVIYCYIWYCLHLLQFSLSLPMIMPFCVEYGLYWHACTDFCRHPLTQLVQFSPPTVQLVLRLEPISQFFKKLYGFASQLLLETSFVIGFFYPYSLPTYQLPIKTGILEYRLSAHFQGRS